MNLLHRLVAGHPRDGTAEALEQQSGILAEPPANRRRHRLPGNPRDLILASLGQKALHGWMQNRHQTLFPLTVNFQTLSPEARDLILRAIATAMMAASPPTPPEQARTWLATVGATAADLARLDEALAAPEPLAPLLDTLLAANLGPYAYAVSLASTDRHSHAGPLYLEYLAARLAIPASVVKSVNRRYAR